VRAPTPPCSLHVVTAFDSKSSSRGLKACPPFADALNHALEQLANIQVNGLPGFKAHIAFVPCNNDVSSDEGDDDSPETSLRFNVAVMLLEDACKLHNLDKLDQRKVSQFIDETKGTPSCFANWKAVLSVIEIEWKEGPSGWPPLEAFEYRNGQVSVMRDTDQWLGGEPDTSKPTSREINVFLYECSLT